MLDPAQCRAALPRLHGVTQMDEKPYLMVENPHSAGGPAGTHTSTSNGFTNNAPRPAPPHLDPAKALDALTRLVVMVEQRLLDVTGRLRDAPQVADR